MLARGRLAVCAAAALTLPGCDNPKALRAARELGGELLGQTPEGQRILAEFDRYAKLAATLRKYHDSGTLEEGDVLGVLRAAGVLAPKPPPPKPGRKPPPPPKPKPYEVPKYAGRYRWPLEAGVVSSEFGARWGKKHHGLDLAADMGVPVFAAAPGEVIYSGDGLRGYGNVVILRHDQKTTSLYAHNRENKVRVGQKVPANAVIAALGSTGRSTGPHVHFELRVDGKGVPPRPLLPRSRF